MIWTLEVNVKADSPDVMPGLLAELVENLRKENYSGTLSKSDGDRLHWNLEASKP